MRSMSFNEAEMMSAPLMVMAVVSSSDADPIASLEELVYGNHMPTCMRNGQYDVNAHRIFVVLHDATAIDPKTGGRSVLTDRNGTPVVSRLDGELLRELALVTEGVYVPAGVAALDLESIVRDHIRPLVKDTSNTTLRARPGEQYPWFVLGSLVSLLGAVWVGASTGRGATRI